MKERPHFSPVIYGVAQPVPAAALYEPQVIGFVSGGGEKSNGGQLSSQAK